MEKIIFIIVSCGNAVGYISDNLYNSYSGYAIINTKVILSNKINRIFSPFYTVSQKKTSLMF